MPDGRAMMAMPTKKESIVPSFPRRSHRRDITVAYRGKADRCPVNRIEIRWEGIRLDIKYDKRGNEYIRCRQCTDSQQGSALPVHHVQNDAHTFGIAQHLECAERSETADKPEQLQHSQPVGNGKKSRQYGNEVHNT